MNDGKVKKQHAQEEVFFLRGTEKFGMKRTPRQRDALASVRGSLREDDHKHVRRVYQKTSRETRRKDKRRRKKLVLVRS